MKQLSLFLVLILTLVPLGACTEPVSEDLSAIGDAFFAALEMRDYGACYEMLPDEKPEGLTLASFIDFYDRAVFSTIGLKEFSWKLESTQPTNDTHAALNYTLTYNCENFDPFTQKVTLELSRTALEWRIAWTPAAVLEGMEWGDKVLLSTLKQKRGEILDQEANAYAINAYGDTVYVRRSKVEDLTDVSTRLAALLQMDAKQIRDIVATESNDDVAVIKVFLPDTIDVTLSEMLVSIPAVGIDRREFRPVRYYPQGATFAHLIGYTHPIDGEIDPQRYDADSRVGVSGLEQAYEDILAGYRGREIAIIAPDGSKKNIVKRIDPVNGIDLTLTLDYELQIRAETLLDRLPQVDATAGAIIVLDPLTGDVLAASSYPDFDPNMYTFAIPNDVMAAMLSPEANQPFHNRITIATYPPGSTIKPFTAAMALQDGILNQNFEFTERIDWKTRQWLPTYPEWNAPPITRVSNYEGPVNMENAIVYSDNIYFGYTALKAGWEHFDPYLEKLGFGKPFPFDTPVKTSQIRNQGSMSNLQLLASTGFGQGEMLISPLQMASIFSAFANDGNIMRPRLVKEFKQMDGMTYKTIGTNDTAVLYEGVLDKSTLDILSPMLRKVITRGSGNSGQLKDIETLGKTGTAEIGGNKEREIAWSISFVRNTDYDRLVCVVLEVPTTPKSAGAYRHTCVKEMLAP